MISQKDSECIAASCAMIIRIEVARSHLLVGSNASLHNFRVLVISLFHYCLGATRGSNELSNCATKRIRAFML